MSSRLTSTPPNRITPELMPETPADPAADLAIRLARAAFNRALAAADLAAITPLLSPQVVLVAGTDSAVISGRKAQLLAWKREFSAPAAQRTLYVRTPERIITSLVEPIAMEHGHWAGTHAATGAPLASGTYAAKWRNLSPTGAAQWVIEAEVFVTLP
jgi:ketosteroid isomerase-like protein